MQIKDIIDIVAILASPIVAVLIGQILLNREKKRSDKMEIFKTLMINRGLAWSTDTVKALNIIEIVFCNDKSVIKQWRKYYDKLCIENPSQKELQEVRDEGNKLLEVIAHSLGYKDKILWDTIQNPYIPKGLTDNLLHQQQFQNAQLDALNYVSAYARKMGLKDDNGVWDHRNLNDGTDKKT